MSKTTLTFSIIIPTYNRGYCIWKAIQSIQRQTYPSFEVLVIDDGSTDNTQQVVAEFQTDPRIQYIRLTSHTNGCVARNEGLKRVTGDIITYVDSDDFVYDHFLQTAREYFLKFPKKIFAIPHYNRRLELYDENFHLIDFVKESSAQKLDIELVDIFHWNVKTCGTGIFHRRKTVKDGVLWDPQIQRAQDWDFLMQLGTKYPDGFMHIPSALFAYLQKYGGDSMCSQGDYAAWGDCFERMYQKHKNDPLLKGQQWYPQKVKKYKKRQELFEKGELPPAMYKNFPNYYKKLVK